MEKDMYSRRSKELNKDYIVCVLGAEQSVCTFSYLQTHPTLFLISDGVFQHLLCDSDCERRPRDVRAKNLPTVFAFQRACK